MLEGCALFAFEFELGLEVAGLGVAGGFEAVHFFFGVLVCVYMLDGGFGRCVVRVGGEGRVDSIRGLFIPVECSQLLNTLRIVGGFSGYVSCLSDRVVFQSGHLGSCNITHKS